MISQKHANCFYMAYHYFIENDIEQTSRFLSFLYSRNINSESHRDALLKDIKKGIGYFVSQLGNDVGDIQDVLSMSHLYEEVEKVEVGKEWMTEDEYASIIWGDNDERHEDVRRKETIC